ncbi:sensor histidine kinase [Paenibacillus sp. M1]|uniref:Sensor histidine kinase n=1 Tax=Paenibacillus haidiansis TaxID=1574488 RepID=A0ABU7VN68_9BACL
MKLRYRKYLGNFGLKRKALAIFLLFVILPTFGVGVVVQYKFNQSLRDQFIGSTRRNLDNVASQLGEQTKIVEDIANYLILNPDMRSFLRTSPPLSNKQQAVYKRNVEEFLTFQLMSRSFIRSIEITGYNGNFIEMGEPFSGDESEWERRAEARKGGIIWTEAYSLNSGWHGETRVLSMFRILNSYNELTRPLGRLTIRMDEAGIVQLLEKGIFEDGAGSVFIIGAEGQIILGSKDKFGQSFQPDATLLGKLASGREGNFNYSLGSKDYLTLYKPVENTGWNVVAMIPEATVAGEFRDVKVMMLFILIAILLLGLAALIGFHYTIITPILRLKKETNRVAHGDFSARVPIESRDEISELNHKFNEMVSTIQQLIEHKYKMELRERESELRLLQNQMDPHFLYNTLDMIRWTARLEKAEKSSQLIEMLSKFFRSSVNNGSYETTLHREMEFVQSYLFLQQRRLGDKLEYSLYTESGLEHTITLKATIQPLVENFIKHGFDRNKAVNEIQVNCYSADREIWIDVIDNGKGMTPARLEEVRASLRGGAKDGNIREGAMRNIHERLSIFYGSGYGLEIIGTSPEGTWVRLRIPAGESEDHGGEQHEP